MLSHQRSHGMRDDMDGDAGDRLHDGERALTQRVDRHGHVGARGAACAGKIGPDASETPQRRDKRLKRARCRAKSVQEDDGRTVAIDFDLNSAKGGAAHARSSRNSFSSTPIRSTSMRATSPGTRYLGGEKPMPTPAGVPVAMTSPGRSVTPAEMVAMIVGTSKMRSRVLAFCRSSPLTQQRIWVSARSTSSFVTAHGPIGQNVSWDLPISH